MQRAISALMPAIVIGSLIVGSIATFGAGAAAEGCSGKGRELAEPVLQGLSCDRRRQPPWRDRFDAVFLPDERQARQLPATSPIAEAPAAAYRP